MSVKLKESEFIKQNKDRWKAYESAYANKEDKSPDELARLYIEITNDLAYAQTYFPDSEVTAYLNNLSTKVHTKLYGTRSSTWQDFKRFFNTDLPLLFFENRNSLILSFLIFAGAMAIGALSAAHDDRFVRLILGDQYVNMTLNNIEKGDPMAVYKQAGETEMFLGITVNNIRVAFLAFVFGILGTVGTIFILFRNGIMVGSFQYFFYEHGLLWESARTVWIHGTLEISAIIIAGAAGIVMGKSFLFPGTYSRVNALLRGAKHGALIILGTVPFFIVAGFLEGYVTRLTEFPDMFNIAIIGGSLLFVLWYVVLYPAAVKKSLRKN